jgi:hypothetical protein
MMSSGLKVPRPAIPIPALDVPKAAPTAFRRTYQKDWLKRMCNELRTAENHLPERISTETCYYK